MIASFLSNSDFDDWTLAVSSSILTCCSPTFFWWTYPCASWNSTSAFNCSISLWNSGIIAYAAEIFSWLLSSTSLSVASNSFICSARTCCCFSIILVRYSALSCYTLWRILAHSWHLVLAYSSMTEVKLVSTIETTLSQQWKNFSTWSWLRPWQLFSWLSMRSTLRRSHSRISLAWKRYRFILMAPWCRLSCWFCSSAWFRSSL